MTYSSKLLSVVVLLMFMASSCTDNFESLNTDPNRVTSIEPGIQLAGAQKDMVFSSNNDYWKTNYMSWGVWAGHWGTLWTAGQTSARYIPMFDWHNDEWQWLYAAMKEMRMGKNLLRDLADEDSDPEIRSRLAIFELMEIRIWDKLTAMIGTVPYEEAVRGLDLIMNPVYDSQEEIYADLLDRLDSALAQLTVGDKRFGRDLIYGGDIFLWRKFGNSLKLRIGMRLSEAAPELAQQAVTEAMNSDLISSNAESAHIPTQTDGDRDQLTVMRGVFERQQQARVGKTLVDKLKEFNDPRLPMMVAPAESDGEFRGVPSGVPETHDMSSADMSIPSLTHWLSTDKAVPTRVLLYSEVAFLQAEAALRGWGAGPGDAESYYREGIRAALTQEPYDPTEAQIQDYLAEHGSLTGNFTDDLEKIATQLWFSFFDHSIMAYLNIRRTGFPEIDPGEAVGVTNNRIPLRGFPHQNESALNGANYQAAWGGRDDYMTEMWLLEAAGGPYTYNRRDWQ